MTGAHTVHEAGPPEGSPPKEKRGETTRVGPGIGKTKH